jgi:hypothetical protein
VCNTGHKKQKRDVQHNTNPRETGAGAYNVTEAKIKTSKQKQKQHQQTTQKQKNATADFPTHTHTHTQDHTHTHHIQARLKNKIFANKTRPKVINLKFFEVAK